MLVTVPTILLGMRVFNTYRMEQYRNTENDLRLIVKDWQLITQSSVAQEERVLKREEQLVIQRLRAIALDVKRMMKLSFEHLYESVGKPGSESRSAHGSYKEFQGKTAGKSLFDEIAEIGIGRSGYVFVIDADGKYVVSEKRRYDGENIFDQPGTDGSAFGKDILKALQELPDEEDTYTIRHSWRDEEYHEPRKMITTLSYFKPWRLIIGVNIYRTDYKSAELKRILQQEVRDRMAEQRIGKEGYVWAINSAGEYVASKDKLRDGESIIDTQDEKGVFVIREIIKKAGKLAPGETYIQQYSWKDLGHQVMSEQFAAIAYVRKWDWIIGASAYQADFMKGLDSIRTHIVIICIISIIIGSLIAYIFALLISGPIKALDKLTLKAADGDLNVEMGENYVTRQDEVGSLSRSFNTMIDKLRDKEDGLARLISLLSATLESTADGILVIDRMGRVVNANRRFGEMWRIPDDLMAKGDDGQLLDFVLGQLTTPEEFMEKVKELYDRPEAESLDTLYFKNGRIFERYSRPQLIAEQIVGRVWSFRDITARKQAEAAMHQLNAELEQKVEKRTSALNKSQHLLQAIIDTSMAVIYVKDLEGRFILINDRFEELFKISREEIIGKSDYDVFPVKMADDFRAFDQRVLDAGTVLEAEEVAPHDDGPHTYISIKSPLLDGDGKPYAVCGLSTDITGRKRDEMEIRRLNKELQQRIVLLQEAQDELVRKGKLSILGQLAGTVGHELRNPLGVMNNAVYFLQMVLPESDETVKEYLGIIKKEIDHSQRIITDLLDFARTKPPHIKDVDLHELVAECTGRCTFPENIDLRIDIPDTLPLLKIDPQQIGQVLQNLIRNGIQAMPDGGVLRLGTRKARNPEAGMEPGAGFIEFFVADTGTGISEDGMKRLFQPLFTTKPKGTGLGLVVCKNLTEANGGIIGVESEPGRGSVFTLTLPMQREV